MMHQLFRWSAVGLLAIGGCAPPAPPDLPVPEFIGAPNPDEVESVIFLVGDAGIAPYNASPTLARMKEDVDYWAERLEGDSAVIALYLGDIIYPLGLHAPDTPEYPADSLQVMAQVEVLSSPAAQEKAHGFFLMGNHDWGLEEDWEGFIRVQRLAEFLERARQRTGTSVRVAPDAGTGGPYTFDVGEYARLILLDTAWWILDGGQVGLDSRGEVLTGVRAAFEEAGDREILMAAHHPFRSAGPHGGEIPFWSTLGVRYLLVRSGALLQDITSRPYRELSDALRSIFADTKRPIAFIGGHEHSLQVFQAVEPTDPVVSVVSGSASKLTTVGTQAGIQFGRSEPGYMKIVIEKDGDMSLFVEATRDEYLACPTEDPARIECMNEGLAAFETVYSQWLQ